jgi:hypothetical protein
MVKKDVKCESDQLSHVYTLRLLPNNTYEVRERLWTRCCVLVVPWLAARPDLCSDSVLRCAVLRCALLLLSRTQVYIDLQPVENGTLYDDFDMLAPRKIKVGLLGVWVWCVGVPAGEG